MATVVIQDSNDPPRLSLSIDRPASSSPFPSPGSPFIPPPRLGAHEFALRVSPTTTSNMRSLIIQKRSRDGEQLALDDQATPKTAVPSHPLPGGASPPDTPTPGSFQQTKSSSPLKASTFTSIPAPPEPSDPPESPMITIPEPDKAEILSPLAPSRRDSGSLFSSRPAPPSPAASRRTSAALSRHSSVAGVSRRQSRAIQPGPSTEPSTSASSLLSPTVPTATHTTSSPAPAKRRSLLVKIRDFAFARADERHVGRGPDVPKANRARRYRASTASASSASSSASSALDADEVGEEDDVDEQQRGSWGSFRWNELSSHFSWAGSSNNNGGANGAGGPSRMDFARNFDVSSPTEESTERSHRPDHEADHVSDGEYDDSEEDGAAAANEDEPLLPGLYKALYAFEPEGTAEMALEEDQIVRVVGRGGGVGWAIVVKEEGGHALVPESYLDLVQLEEVDSEAEAETETEGGERTTDA